MKCTFRTSKCLTLVGPVIVLLASATEASVQQPREPSVQEAILRSKPAVALVVVEVAADVLLNCGDGERQVSAPPFRRTGTAWIIDAGGYLVTNGHVVEPAHAPPSWLFTSLARSAVEAACLPARLERLKAQSGGSLDAAERLKRRLYESVVPKARLTLRPSIAVVLSNGAPHPAAVKKYTPPAKGSAEMFGTDLALLRIAATDLPVLPLGNAQKVLAGDPVRILGFPGVVLNHELLKETAVVEASVTTGAISGFKKDVADNPVIQTDAPAAWGNSGGPAMNARGDVIGVLTFVSVTPGPEGGLVQGFNFIIPAATVLRFIEGTEVTLSGRSRFNEAWWGGLGHYFRGDFPRAVKSFEAANQLHPGVPDVQRLLDEGKGRPAPFPWVWLAAGIAIAGAGICSGLWGLRWKRNRFRISPQEVVRLMEASPEHPPLLLDIRSTDAYEKSPLRIPSSIRITPQELESGRPGLALDPARTIVVHCTSRHEAASARVARQLRRLGCRDVRILEGGLAAWTNAGLPLDSKPTLPQKP